MAWQAESPAMAPVLSFSVVAPETYARATATLPKTGTAHLHKYQPDYNGTHYSNQSEYT